MAEYLIGAEDVSRAARTMQNAAEQMRSAAGYFESVFTNHQRFMDDWLIRLDGTLQDRTNDLGVTLGPMA